MPRTFYSHTKNVRRSLPPGKETNIFVMVTDKEQTGAIRNIDFSTIPKKKTKMVNWALWIQRQDGVKTTMEKIVDSKAGYDPEIDLFIDPGQEIMLTAKNTDTEEIEGQWVLEILQENYVVMPEATGAAAKPGAEGQAGVDAEAGVDAAGAVAELMGGGSAGNGATHVPGEGEVLVSGVPMPENANYPVREVAREEIRKTPAPQDASGPGWGGPSARKSLLGNILKSSVGGQSGGQSSAPVQNGSSSGAKKNGEKSEEDKEEK